MKFDRYMFRLGDFWMHDRFLSIRPDVDVYDFWTIPRPSDFAAYYGRDSDMWTFLSRGVTR